MTSYDCFRRGLIYESDNPVLRYLPMVPAPMPTSERSFRRIFVTDENVELRFC